MQQNKHNPTDAEIDDVHFDFSAPIAIPTEQLAGDDAGWQLVKRGSDAHIQFLEHALTDLQATLARLKAERAKRQG